MFMLNEDMDNMIFINTLQKMLKQVLTLKAIGWKDGYQKDRTNGLIKDELHKKLMKEIVR